MEDFFRAFVPGVFEFADFAALEYLDKEHGRARKRPRRRGDLLIKTRWHSREAAFLIHMESHSRAEAIVLERAGEYSFRDSIRYGLPVMPVLLLTYTKPAKPHPVSLAWTFGEIAELRLRCPVLHFARMDPRPHLASGNIAALALSSLMRLNAGQQVEAIVQTLAESLRQRLSPEEMEAAWTFLRHYTPLDAGQLLHLERRVRKLSEDEPELAPMPTLVNPFVELGKLKGHELGRAEGRAEGRVEGHADGHADGQMAMVLHLLRQKFPRIASKAAGRVKALDEPGRLAFGKAMLFFENEAECLAWLERA